MQIIQQEAIEHGACNIWTITLCETKLKYGLWQIMFLVQIMVNAQRV